MSFDTPLAESLIVVEQGQAPRLVCAAFSGEDEAEKTRAHQLGQRGAHEVHRPAEGDVDHPVEVVGLDLVETPEDRDRRAPAEPRRRVRRRRATR